MVLYHSLKCRHYHAARGYRAPESFNKFFYRIMADPSKPPFSWHSLNDFLQYKKSHDTYSGLALKKLGEFIADNKITIPKSLQQTPDLIPMPIKAFRIRKAVSYKLVYQKVSRLIDGDFDRSITPFLKDIEDLCLEKEFIDILHQLNLMYPLPGDFGRLQKELELSINNRSISKMIPIATELRRNLLLQQLLGGKKTSHQAQYFKKLLFAQTLFYPENAKLKYNLIEDIKSIGNGSKVSEAPFEFLLCIIPKELEGLLFKHFYQFRDLFVTQMLQLPLRANFRTNVITSIKQCHSYGEFEEAFKKIEKYFSIVKIPLQVQDKLQKLIDLYRSRIKHVTHFYRQNFLNNELAAIRPIYLQNRNPSKHIEKKESIARILLMKKDYTLYPTKDYHDFFKGHYSHDCTADYPLATKHLTYKGFFNIRIFEGDRWVGNIYMVDLIAQTGCLVIDRIQIKKGEKILAPAYFPKLKVALTELFKNVDYKYVITPSSTISNFSFFQKLYSRYKTTNKMKRIHPKFYETSLRSFESFAKGRNSEFRVFIEK